MCVDAIHACEIVAGTGAGDELDGTSGPNRLVSDGFARSILQGLDGDDILIGRATLDVIDGGAGDDTFYIKPRNAMSITTGPGRDLIVVDEASSNFN